jgi:hypothetical protein
VGRSNCSKVTLLCRIQGKGPKNDRGRVAVVELV